MEETLRVNTNGGRLDRELALDWLTALVPIFLVSFYYYRWRALALADRRYAPLKISEQLLVGGLAGLLTALWRLWGPWAEGTAVAALVAQLFTPFAPAALRGLKALWRLIRRLLRRGLSLLRQKIAHFTTARRTPHTSAPGTPKDTPFETK